MFKKKLYNIFNNYVDKTRNNACTSTLTHRTELGSHFKMGPLLLAFAV